MDKNLLPLGTVVYLKEGSIPLMLISRQPVLNLKGSVVYFDYAAENQILGLDPDQLAYFNHEDIQEVIFEGYRGPHEERILKSLEEWREDHPDILKGVVR